MESKELYLVYQSEGDEYESYERLLYITEDPEEAERFKEEWDRSTVYDEKNNVMDMEEYEKLNYGMDDDDSGEGAITAKGGHTVEEFIKMSDQWDLMMNGKSPCRIEKGYTNKVSWEWI